jgi:hypothetical protein
MHYALLVADFILVNFSVADETFFVVWGLSLVVGANNFGYLGYQKHQVHELKLCVKSIVNC